MGKRTLTCADVPLPDGRAGIGMDISTAKLSSTTRAVRMTDRMYDSSLSFLGRQHKVRLKCLIGRMEEAQLKGRVRWIEKSENEKGDVRRGRCQTGKVMSNGDSDVRRGRCQTGTVMSDGDGVRRGQ